MHRSVPSLLVAAVLLALGGLTFGAAPAAADAVFSYTGSNVGGPLWLRPGWPNQVRYHAQMVTIQGGGDCVITSGQNYDGYLYVYDGSFSPATPNAGLLASDDDGSTTLGTHVGTSEVTVSLGAGDRVLVIVTTSYAHGQSGSFHNTIQCDVSSGNTGVLLGACPAYVSGIPVANQVCLDDGFAVAIDGVSNSSLGGIGVPVNMGSTNSAFFWFYNDRNFEVVVKVLNACSFPQGHPQRGYWVFGAALTTQAFQVKVRAPNGVQRVVYSNALNTPATALTRAPEFDESFCP